MDKKLRFGRLLIGAGHDTEAFIVETENLPDRAEIKSDPPEGAREVVQVGTCNVTMSFELSRHQAQILHLELFTVPIWMRRDE